MEVTRIDIHGGEIESVVTGESASEDYEVLCRMWVNSNGEKIREWSPREYIKHNPYEKIIIPRTIFRKGVEAHCVELRNRFAYKDGKKVLSFMEVVDYEKESE